MNNLNNNVEINEPNNTGNVLNQFVDADYNNTDRALTKIENIVRSAIETSEDNLINESTSISESFPHYGDPTKGIFAQVKKIHNEVKDLPDMKEFVSSSEGNKLTDLIENQINGKTNISNVFTPETLLQNWKERPFGSFGENTLNNLCSKAIKADYHLVSEYVDVSVKPFALIPYGLMYSSLVKLYARNMRPISEYNHILSAKDKLEFLRRRNLNITVFMGITAPMITYFFINYITNHSVLDSFIVNLHQGGSGAIDTTSAIAQSSENLKLLPFLSLFNKNKGGKIFKVIFSILVSMGLLLYFVGIDNILLFIININSQYFKVFCLIIVLLCNFYYISSLFLYSLFYTNEINIPEMLPSFIQRWLVEIKTLSRSAVFWIIIRETIVEISILTILLIFIILSFKV